MDDPRLGDLTISKIADEFDAFEYILIRWTNGKASTSVLVDRGSFSKLLAHPDTGHAAKATRIEDKS